MVWLGAFHRLARCAPSVAPSVVPSVALMQKYGEASCMEQLCHSRGEARHRPYIEKQVSLGNSRRTEGFDG